VSEAEGDAVDEVGLHHRRPAHGDDGQGVFARWRAGGVVDLVGAVTVGEADDAEVATGAVRLSQRVIRRPRGDAKELVDDGWSRLTAVAPGRGVWAQAFGFAAANWLWDCLTLALCFMAVGEGVPWQGLLLAYGAAQLAVNIPITPGGLGVVEGSLTIALVAYGGPKEATVAAVVLYRLISFWGLLVVGWVAWAALAYQTRRQERAQTARAEAGAVA